MGKAEGGDGHVEVVYMGEEYNDSLFNTILAFVLPKVYFKLLKKVDCVI